MNKEIQIEKNMVTEMRKIIKNGSLKQLKLYFFDSKHTQNEVYNDLQYNINEAFINSCYYGKLSFVQYLLTSPELPRKADLHYKVDGAIFNAVEGCNSEIIDYLLYSQQIQEHLDLNKHINEVFDNIMADLYIQDENSINGDASSISINQDAIKIMNFLIYDYSISPTEHIIELLKEYTKKTYCDAAIKKLNNNLLYNNLVEKTIVNKKEEKKIKI